MALTGKSLELLMRKDLKSVERKPGDWITYGRSPLALLQLLEEEPRTDVLNVEDCMPYELTERRLLKSPSRFKRKLR